MKVVKFYRNYKNGFGRKMTNFEYEFPKTKIERLS